MKVSTIKELNGIVGAYNMFRCEEHLGDIVVISNVTNSSVAKITELMSVEDVNVILKTYSIKVTYSNLRTLTLEEVILMVDENSVTLLRSSGNWIIIERNRNMVDLNVWLRKLKYVYKGGI